MRTTVLLLLSYTRLTLRVVPHYGLYGDNWEPVVASIERGQVQYIASDHLTELTLAILQKDRQRDPSLGYACDVVPMLLRLWQLMQTCGVRFVCNAGGLNPMGAALAAQTALAVRFQPIKVEKIEAGVRRKHQISRFLK